MREVSMVTLGGVMVATLAVGTAAGVAAAPAERGDGVTSFVGKVRSTDRYIGLVREGDQLAGYVCDNDGTSVWFDVTDVRNGRAALRDRQGARIGTVRLGSKGPAKGTVVLDGDEYRFRATRARGDAGLYRAAVERDGALALEVGWVVLADGTQRGAATTFVEKIAFAVEPAPRLDPTAPVVNVVDFGAITANLVAPGFINKTIFNR